MHFLKDQNAVCLLRIALFLIRLGNNFTGLNFLILYLTFSIPIMNSQA